MRHLIYHRNDVKDAKIRHNEFLIEKRMIFLDGIDLPILPFAYFTSLQLVKVTRPVSEISKVLVIHWYRLLGALVPGLFSGGM